MKVTRPTLMAAPPPGPAQEQRLTARRRPEQVREQMTHFRNGQRQQGEDRCFFGCLWLSDEHASRSANACKADLDDHDERDVPVPTGPASDFVIREAHVFCCLETFFNTPSLSDSLDHFDERGTRRGKHEVVRFFARIVQATTDQ